MSSLLEELTTVFREVFGDAGLTLSAATSAADVEGWDSLMHLNLIIALEQRFAVTFSTAEISQLKEDGQNVGHLLALLSAKQRGAA
jgi:acyl carrier protein